MNSLKMNEVIYKIQDLVIKKELTSYEKFKTHFKNEIKFDKKLRSHKFINDLFKKIYTFLKSIILVQALKPMFVMLLNDMMIPKFVRVSDFSGGSIFSGNDPTKVWKYNIRRSGGVFKVGYDIFIGETKRIKSTGLEDYIKKAEERERRLNEAHELWCKKKIENIWIHFQYCWFNCAVRDYFGSTVSIIII